MLIRLWDLTDEASVYFFWDFLRGSDLSQGLGLLQQGESCIAPVIMGIISYVHHHLHRNHSSQAVCICLLLQGSPHIVLSLAVYFGTLHRKHFQSAMYRRLLVPTYLLSLFNFHTCTSMEHIVTLHSLVLALLE